MVKKTKTIIEEVVTMGNDGAFILEKKTTQKKTKVNFPVYMDADKVNRLDTLCKRNGYSRNELINNMVGFCLENLEIR